MPWYENFRYETEGKYVVRVRRDNFDAMKEVVAFLRKTGFEEVTLFTLEGVPVRLRADSVPEALMDDIARVRELGTLKFAGPYPTKPTAGQLALESCVRRLRRQLASAQEALNTCMQTASDE